MSRSPLNNWIALTLDAARLGLEAQQVVALRLMHLAAGGPTVGAEAQRMVSEKAAAFVEAQIAIAAALARGSGHGAARQALGCYRRRVRANARRLSRKAS